MSDKDPLAHLLAARYLSSAGACVQEVCLLVQKDMIEIAPRVLSPQCNPDIDGIWQRLGQSLLSDRHAPTLWFDHQVTEDGVLLPWRPLFYCRKADVFFESVCPVCGGFLEVCRDDDLLARHGLQFYTKSLRRYLYCPECHAAKTIDDFYLPMRQIGDPLELKDQHDLITAIGELARSPDKADRLPCHDCRHWSSCYENERRAFSRVTSLAFFPFHMVALKAPYLHLLDFLPLLAGAREKEVSEPLRRSGALERARRVAHFEASVKEGRRMLFEGRAQHFFELLYLKLALLDEISQAVFRRRDHWQPQGLNLDMEHFWLRMPPQARLLPQSWNARIQIVGVGPMADPEDQLPSGPPAHWVYQLGLIWLHVLVVNDQQDLNRVHAEARAVLESWPPQDEHRGPPIQRDRLPVAFAAEQIFWHPGQTAIPADGLGIWTTSLQLGFELLRYGLGAAAAFSPPAFQENLAMLHQEVRDRLFAAPPVDTRLQEENGAVLRNIILDIKRKWQATSEMQWPQDTNGEASVSRPDQDIAGPAIPTDDVVKETVVLKASDFTVPDIGRPEPRPDLPETVIYTPEAPSPHRSPADRRLAYDDLAETVIIPTGDAARPPVPENRLATDDIPETIVHRPPTEAAKDLPGDRHTEDPPATVVMRKPDGDGPQPPTHPQPADDIPETIVVRPDGGAGGGSNDAAQGTGALRGGRSHTEAPPETVVRRRPDESASPGRDNASLPEDLPETVVVKPRKPNASANDRQGRRKKGEP